MNYDKIFSMESIDKQKEDEYFVFIRLYKAEYKDPTNICHVIDKTITAANDSAIDNMFYNHVAMNYKLTDDYMGLTLSGETSLKYEKCTKTDDNKYMAGCDDKKSIYSVYSIKVKKNEYQRIIKLLNNHEEIKKFKYSVLSLVKLLGGIIEAKKREVSVENINLPFKIFNDENGFCCSTMVAYILEKCAPSVSNKVKLKVSDYSKITPSGLTKVLPDCNILFGGKWANYNKDLEKFLKINPSFNKFVEVL